MEGTKENARVDNAKSVIAVQRILRGRLVAMSWLVFRMFVTCI